MGFEHYSGGGICDNLGTRYGIEKENGIWDRDDRSSGCGIVMETGSDPQPPTKHPLRSCSNDRCSSKERSGHIYFNLWKIIYNMQSQSYDICVAAKEEVAYDRWSPTRGSSVVVIGGPH